MLDFRVFTFSISLLLLSPGAHAVYGPELRVHRGELNIQERGIEPHEYITQYTVGEMYTFEVFLDETMQHDYMVKQCYMNNQQIIGEFGCVECGNCVSKSVETESYNKPGAVKRTMITFAATETVIRFECVIDKIDCSGCAERSCQRRDQIALHHFHHTQVSMMYPPQGYAAPGAFPIPIPPNIYPTPPFGGYNMPPHAPPVPPPVPPPMSPGGVAPYGGAAGVWPWWLWLLILLLLLLLLCCLLALCFAAFMKRRKERKAAAAAVIVSDNKDCAVGTDRVSVTCVGTDTKDIVKVQPAVVLGADDLHHQHQHNQQSYNRNDFSRTDFDQGSVMAGGSYSLREGMVHEGYTRTLPRESYPTADRYASRDRFERNASGHDNGRFTDRSSYRNFAYERDMGRVEPMDGYDEVETRERTYCLSDDDQEVVEKNITRTHTTRYVTESREYEHDNEERNRGDEYHHATYTHSLPV